MIDELGSFGGASDPECRQALKACSLASSSFLPSSRKYLFAEVRLKECAVGEDLETSSGLACILDVLVEDSKIKLSSQHIPPLASHIRTLCIILSPIRAYHQKNFHTNSPSDVPAILEILIANSLIASFSLKFAVGGAFVEWTYVDEALKAGIKSLCRSPSITTLQFQGIQGLPTSLIRGCPNLKALFLDSVSCLAASIVHASSPTFLSPKKATGPTFLSPKQATGCCFSHLEFFAVSGSEFRQVLEPLLLSRPSSLTRLRHIEFSVDVILGVLMSWKS